MAAAEPRTVLEAEYFVDPICSWSWSNEPRVRRFLARYGAGVFLWRRMGGLMARRDAGFFDPQYDLGGADPGAYARHQGEVCAGSGMPFDARVWSVHPPETSHAACIAVKAAQRQGHRLGDAYLRRVQEAFFTECRAVEGFEVLLALAREVPGLDELRFGADLEGPRARRAFEADWEAARNPVPEARDIKTTEGRLRYAFPTLVLANAAGRRRVLDGGSPEAAYGEAVAALAPDLKPAASPDPRAFLKTWGSAATREVEVVCGLDRGEAEAALERLAAAGEAAGRPVGATRLWTWIGP